VRETTAIKISSSILKQDPREGQSRLSELGRISRTASGEGPARRIAECAKKASGTRPDNNAYYLHLTNENRRGVELVTAPALFSTPKMIHFYNLL
jgi:hypothetical protein